MIFYRPWTALLALTSLALTSPVLARETRSAPSEEDLGDISRLVGLALKRQYPGTGKTRPGKRGPTPVWSQRTAILYYHRIQAGEPVIWMTLALGVVGNMRDLISNKKTWMGMWKEASPETFAKLETHLPRDWSDLDSFRKDADPRSMYVYKPIFGHMGEGITFRDGGDMIESIVEQERRGGPRNWVIQEFVDPYLFNNRKTHIRVLTLAIVQPDGSRDFYIYDRMRLFTAFEEFDAGRLAGSKDNTDMLITNNAHVGLAFKSKPENERKVFYPSRYLFDAESAMGADLFRDVYSKATDMHELIYGIIGDVLQCEPTEVSIYDNSCFHIMASDVALDKNGKMFFLEMNTGMGYNPVWNKEEQSEFLSGVANLVKGTASPYAVGNSYAWKELHV